MAVPGVAKLGGKIFGNKVAKEGAEELVEETAEKLAKEGAEELAEESAEKLSKEGVEGTVERLNREVTQQDIDSIINVKTKYNAGKTRNGAVANGKINGQEINLEIISGKFTDENYFNKGNFKPPQPEDYIYNGPIPEFTNHTEQKIVEYLRTLYKNDTNVIGEIEIISERIFCDNCSVIVDLFQKEFPNIKVNRVEIK